MKQFISNLLPARDKLMHMLACTYIYELSSQFVVAWVALIIALVAAIGVEVWDKLSGKGTAEFEDASWGAIAALVPFAFDTVGVAWSYLIN